MIGVPAATGGKIISTVKDPAANVPAPGFILWNPVDFVPPPASLPKRVFILPERIKRKRGVAKIVNSKKLDRYSIYPDTIYYAGLVIRCCYYNFVYTCIEEGNCEE